MPTVTQIVIQIAPISEVLASNDVANGVLFGEPLNAMWPIQIYVETQSCLFRYQQEGISNGNPPSQTMINNANYLYSIICGGYGQRALFLIDSGGAVPSPTPQPSQGYGIPISSQYTAVNDGEFELELRDVNGNLLPTGSLIVWVQKSTTPLPLQSVQYRYIEPNLVLLDGISMGADEILSFLYVVPI